MDQPDPKIIGNAIDWAIEVCEAAENQKTSQRNISQKSQKD
jgi:hypothetical protein